MMKTGTDIRATESLIETKQVDTKQVDTKQVDTKQANTKQINISQGKTNHIHKEQ